MVERTVAAVFVLNAEKNINKNILFQKSKNFLKKSKNFWKKYKKFKILNKGRLSSTCGKLLKTLLTRGNENPTENFKDNLKIKNNKNKNFLIFYKN